MTRLPDAQLARVLLLVTALREAANSDGVTDQQLDTLIDALEEELPIADLEALVYECCERRADARAEERGLN